MATVAKPGFETTLEVRDACLCLHVQRAARALARRFDEALRPLGLTNGQSSLMMSLNRPEPPGMAPVASLLGMDRTTLTAVLKALQRRGLVKVTADQVGNQQNSDQDFNDIQQGYMTGSSATTNVSNNKQVTESGYIPASGNAVYVVNTYINDSTDTQTMTITNGGFLQGN